MATAPALRSDPLGRLLSAEVYAAVNAVDALALLHVDETYDDDGTRHVRLAEHAVEALECALDEHVPAHARMLTPLVLVSALALAEPPLDGLGAYVAARRALLGPHLEPCPAEAWRALELMHLTVWHRLGEREPAGARAPPCPRDARAPARSRARR